MERGERDNAIVRRWDGPTLVAAFIFFICLASTLTLQPAKSDANFYMWIPIIFLASLHTAEGLKDTKSTHAQVMSACTLHFYLFFKKNVFIPLASTISL